MMKYLKRYNEIMRLYRSGAYGQGPLTMHDILIQAGEDGLLNKMCLSEITSLRDGSQGISKHLFHLLWTSRKSSIDNIAKLEKELEGFDLQKYCDPANISIYDLAKNLNLEVQCKDTSSLPRYVEATLSPPTNNASFGVIKISDAIDNHFSYMHEIMHYFRNVGVGNVVAQEYTRKSKGKTDSPEEQEINYLAAAAVMPISKILQDLDAYENVACDKEVEFLSEMSKKYHQDIHAVSRRFVEVRNLLDSGYLVSG